MKIQNLISITLSISLFLLVGCAEPKRPVTLQVAEKITSVDHSISVMQDELAITVSQTNPGNTGALGAIIAGVIDAGRQNSAEKKSKPILETLEDFDFRQSLLAELNSSSAKSGYVVNNSLNKLADKEKKKGVYSRSSASAVMISDVYYSLESGGNFNITAEVEMYPNSPALSALLSKPNASDSMAKNNRIYQNTFSFDRRAVYSENILETLDDGIKSIADQIMEDISSP